MNRNKINEERQQINVDIERKKNHLVIKINRLINKINQIRSYQKEIDYYINNKDKCKQKLNKAITNINTISNEYTQQYPTTLTENITTKTKKTDCISICPMIKAEIIIIVSIHTADSFTLFRKVFFINK